MRNGFSIRIASALIFVLLMGTVAGAICLSGHDGGQGQRASILTDYPITVNITVKDNLGRLIQGAQVNVVGSASSYPLSDANGTVLITDLYGSDIEPGTSYNFTASKVGYAQALQQSWIMANHTANITLVITGATVYGIVLTSLGHPVDGANVSVSSTTPPRVEFNVSTGSDGGYQISGIPGGHYDISASMDGYMTSVAYNVNLSAGQAQRQDFNLTPLSGSISGFVRDDEGTALEGANVSVTIGALTITRQTNSTGFFNQTALPEGTYSVTASLNGFYPSTITGILVTRGLETKNVNLTLAPKPNKLYGVVKAGTLLLPGVNISILGTSYHNISNYEGSYQITNITAGTYNISASLSGYATNVTQVSIPAGSDILLLINLRQLPGAQLLVKVTATDTNAPLVGVLVTIFTKGGEPITQTTNIDGKFAFTGLMPGNYTIQMVKEGYRPLEIRDIGIAAEENESLNLLMEPLRSGDTGFIFGFDVAHSMMILALFLTIIILAMAVWLRIKTFQAPENAPAVYDEAPEEGAEVGDKAGQPEEENLGETDNQPSEKSEKPKE